MSDRPTPMTDQFCADHDFQPNPAQCLNFASLLERQLAEAKDALETIAKVASRYDWIGPAGEMDAALAACQATLDKLNKTTP